MSLLEDNTLLVISECNLSSKILLISSFQNKITGVESRWYMKPSLLIDSLAKNERSFLEERWELVCSKSRLKLSSWIITARLQGHDRRTIKVYKANS